MARAHLLFIPSLTLLAACATPPPAAYRAETFAAESPFTLRTQLTAAGACDTGGRALLSQGYEIDTVKPERVRGTKYFQPKPEHHMALEITLVCLPDESGAVIYASARQTDYALKSGSSTAGVSVAGMGSLSLPWLSDKESLIKVGEVTVTDQGFYDRLFGLIATMLP